MSGTTVLISLIELRQLVLKIISSTANDVAMAAACCPAPALWIKMSTPPTPHSDQAVSVTVPMLSPPSRSKGRHLGGKGQPGEEEEGWLDSSSSSSSSSSS